LTVVRVITLLAGVALVAATLGSAVRTVILPRGVPAKLARWVFLWMRLPFRIRMGRAPSYEKRDRIMALYAPLSLLVLLAAWVSLVLLGFTGIFWGLGGRSLQDAFYTSGSSILTLGFQHADDLLGNALVFTEAAFGLVLLAMLITYLPSLYSAFSRREATVTALEVRAGSPPSGVEMLERFWIVDRMAKLGDLWERWESWFVDIEETHTSFPALVFFRSPQPDHSWVTAAGAILDGASLLLSSVEGVNAPEAAYCIRSGYLALRRVADFFRIPYDPAPLPTDPITIARDEFDDAYERLAAAGIPMNEREQAWKDFAGWRVNYDTVLVALAALTMAPYAQWSSDRSLRTWRPPMLIRLTQGRA
jgi:hypothetical protein